jgi:hypothetical protein
MRASLIALAGACSLLIATALLCSGCYTVNLNSIPAVQGSPMPVTAQLDIPPETAVYTYDVRSMAAGAANRFRILVGESLVQYAGAYLRPAFPDGNDVTIRITINSFHVQDFEAHITARFMMNQRGRVILDRTYDAAGEGYFAQTVWGGAFAMKSSMRKTTDEALRSIFVQFLADVLRHYGGLIGPDPKVRLISLGASDPA